MKIIAFIFTTFLLIPTQSSLAGDSSQFKNCDDFYSFASDSYQKFIEVSGDDYDARLKRMKALRLILIEEAYRCSGHGESMKLMARININAFNNKTALEYAKAAVAASPDDAEANNILGTIYSLLGGYEFGIPYLEKAASLDPSLTRDLCSNYEMAGQYQNAIKACTNSIENEDNEMIKASSIYVRGRAYKALNITDKAEDDFSRAKQLGYDGEQFYAPEHLGTE